MVAREYNGRELLVGSLRDRRASDEDADAVALAGAEPGKRKTDDRAKAGDGSETTGAALLRSRMLGVNRWAEDDDRDAGPETSLIAALGIVEESRGSHPLPAELAKKLGAELGIDLGSVRLHDDSRAHQAAAQLKARAFTIGNDIYFAAGAYDPNSTTGIELIAHEVAHVAQHARGTAPTGRGVSKPGDRHEVEAGEFARTFRQRVEHTAKPGADPAELVEHARREGRRIGLPFQAELEQQLGTSFDHVEAFTGPAAQLACEALGASAFVIRNLIMLADPSPQRDLLVHELTHIQQMGQRRAPARFALGTLRVSSVSDAAEVEARQHAAVPGAGPLAPKAATMSADVDTIHRSGPAPAGATPDPAADPAATPEQRIAYFVANAPIKSFPIDGAGGEKVYAFMDPASEHRYAQSSPEPWKRSDYAAIVAKSGLPVVGDSTHTTDIAKMKSEGSTYRLASVSPSTYAFIKDGTWVSDVTDIRPGARAEVDPSVQFSCYLNVITKLKDKGRAITFTWKGGTEAFAAEVRTFQASEATDYRRALRAALVASYMHEKDGGWEIFYNEVMKPHLIPKQFNGLTGSIFEELIKATTGKALDNVRPMFSNSALKNKRTADNASGNVIIDGKAAEAGIDMDQARDYFKIIGGDGAKIPGWVKGEDEDNPRREYEAVLYTVAGKPIANTVDKQLNSLFKGPFRDKFGSSPTPDGVTAFLAKFNPTLSFTTKEKGKSTYIFHNPTSQLSGMGVKTVTINTSADGTKVTGGSIDFGLDLAGAIKNESIKKPIKPSVDPLGLAGSVENKFTGFKSSLDKVLGVVDVDAKLVDGGVEASIALKPGASKIPGFDVNAAALTARYVNGGMQVDGEVTITHKSKKISGTVKLGWDGAGWTLDGKATMAAGLVPGLSEVALGVSYAAGKTSITCPQASYHQKVGAIDLTGTVRNLKYDVNTAGFSGAGELLADMGPFGTASATATFENNQLKTAAFSYDSPEFKYPAKSDKPGFKGKVGGTLTYAAGKFSGDIRGSANVNIPGLKAIAGDSGVGLAVDAHVNADGSYSGTVRSTSPLKFGKHVQIPSVSCTLDKDGALSGSFEIDVVNIKYLTNAKIKCNVSKAGIEIADAHIEVAFGSEEKNKFWGKLAVGYTQGQGLQIGGTVNYKIKEGMVATGTLTYSTETNAVSLEMTVSEIKLLDKTVKKTLFKGGKQIPVVNIWGLGIYIDIGFELGFNFGFSVGLKPTVKFEGLSLDTWEFKQITAQMELLGAIYAELVGTPKLGIGVFVLDPAVLRGGGGLKMPIVGRADLKPTGTFNLAYSPSGSVTGDAKLSASLMFGINASVTPYAEFAVLNGLWNPSWEGSPLAQFDILKPKELFKFELDFGGDMTKKEAPPLPAENAAPDAGAGGGTANKGMTQKDSAPQIHDNGAANKDQPAAAQMPAEGGEEGPFSLSALIEKMKGNKGFATAQKVFGIAKKLWDVVKGVYDLVKPLFDVIKGRVEEFINLFDAELPKSGADIMPWVWKLAKAVFGLAFGSLFDLIGAIKKMLGNAASFARKLITHAVQEGQIGVRRHQYYIWRPWPMDDYKFWAASEYKVNIPGVISLGRHGPDGILINPHDAIAIGLYEVLDDMGVPHTTGSPNNDIWVGG